MHLRACGFKSRLAHQPPDERGFAEWILRRRRDEVRRSTATRPRASAATTPRPRRTRLQRIAILAVDPLRARLRPGLVGAELPAEPQGRRLPHVLRAACRRPSTTPTRWASSSTRSSPTPPSTQRQGAHRQARRADRRTERDRRARGRGSKPPDTLDDRAEPSSPTGMNVRARGLQPVARRLLWRARQEETVNARQARRPRRLLQRPGRLLHESLLRASAARS